jgi:hypothetical protein
VTADRAALLEAARHVDDHPVVEHLVPHSLRQAAAWGAKWAARKLGARRVPEIRWAQGGRPELLGVKAATSVGADTIWILDDVSLSEAAGLAAHETHHVLVDEDEGRARAFQVAAKAAWDAERAAQREQLWHELGGLYNRFCPDGRWEREAGAKRVAAWYGSATLGFVPALVVGTRDLQLRLAELEQFAPADPLGHLKRAAKPARAIYSFEVRGT